MPVRLSFALLLMVSMIGCNQPTLPPEDNSGKVEPTATVDPKSPPLYTPKPWVETTPSDTAKVEPIVISQAHLVVVNKQDVPSPQDGLLYFIGTEATNDEVANLPEDRIATHPETGKKFRILHEGDEVKAGQMLAQMDDRRALSKLASAKAAVDAAKLEESAATKVVGAARVNQKMTNAGGTSKLEILKADLEVERSIAEAGVKAANILKAESDQNEAEVSVKFHQVRAATSGKIQKIHRLRGESVKFGDTIMTIHDTGKLRVEGTIELQYANELAKLRQKNQPVIVEPTLVASPLNTLKGHMQPVTSVAVSKKGLILSASEDRTLRVWYKSVEKCSLSHPVGVKAIAASPATADRHFVVSGADDGKVRLWELDTVTASSVPNKEMDGKHVSAIASVAVSPDGKSCATACEREVIIWNVDSRSADYGKVRYKLSGQRGLVTALHFLPQAKLVTIGRDNTLRVWDLREAGARIEMEIERRSGDVPQLGVSADGGRVLYDTGRSLSVLTLPSKRTEGIIQNPNDASKFSTFALFSPNGRMVLTAGSTEGRLQLWRAPSASLRGTELRQFVPQDRTSVATCAAFSSDNTFAVSGSQDRMVYVWGLPTAESIDKTLSASLTNIETIVDSSARQVRITAELVNPGGLTPGTTVSLVAQPVQ